MPKNIPIRIKWLALFVLILVGTVMLGGCSNHSSDQFVPRKSDKFTHRVAYIDSSVALAKSDLEICNEKWIFDYYNPERARYIHGKNGLRKFILSNYVNRNYSDSGYFNVRFVINCKGEAGRYIVHENDLDLEPYTFSEDLKNQLLELTVQLKEWKPNFTKGEARDSYMYISYRIVNGEITEILP